MVYGEPFLRNFKFYAKTLTKLHDLTELTFSENTTNNVVFAQLAAGSPVKSQCRGIFAVMFDFRSHLEEI
jgi:hypothetical protein